MNFEEALFLAKEAHEKHPNGGKDKCDVPYILHPVEVCFMLGAESEDVKVVALLHDVIEDCPWILHKTTNNPIHASWKHLPKEIRNRYFICRSEDSDGTDIKELSRAQYEALDAITRKPHPEETYKQYIERVKRNEIATMVKIADLKHNLSEPRMHCLSEGERRGLTRRYTWSLKELEGA